jgi:hypothetical protein
MPQDKMICQPDERSLRLWSCFDESNQSNQSNRIVACFVATTKAAPGSTVCPSMAATSCDASSPEMGRNILFIYEGDPLSPFLIGSRRRRRQHHHQNLVCCTSCRSWESLKAAYPAAISDQASPKFPTAFVSMIVLSSFPDFCALHSTVLRTLSHQKSWSKRSWVFSRNSWPK